MRPDVLQRHALQRGERPEAKTMFYALYRFGHHGVFAIKKAKPVKPSEVAVVGTEEIPRTIPVSASEIDATRDWIRSTEPSIEQIEQRADAEGH